MGILFINRLDKIINSINKTIAHVSKEQGGDHNGLTHRLVMDYGDLYLVNKEEKGNNQRQRQPRS